MYLDNLIVFRKGLCMKNTEEKISRKSNGEGSLRFDEKTNLYRYQVSYYAPTGERKRKTFTGKTKSEVKKKRRDFERDLALGKITETVKCTVVDLLKEQVEYDYKMGIIQENAYSRQLYTIRIIEKSAIGNVPLSKLNEKQINDFLFSIKRYSNSLINKLYGSLRRAYRIAVGKKLIVFNLMDSPFIKKPKSDKPTKKVYAFTCEEQTAFVKALKTKRYQAKNIDYNSMLMIELYSGLRMGEVCALTPKDIDLKNNVIHVRNTVTRGLDSSVKVGNRTKTPRGVRDVPINPLLVETLEKVLNDYVENKDNLLFYNTKMERPVSTQQANDYFHRLCDKAEIKPTGGTHTLRHTFATRCIEASVQAEILSKWLGHTDISITLNTYCDVFSKMHDDAIEKFSNYCKENVCA